MRYLYVFCLLLISSVSFAQDWTFYGFFPTISQSGNLSKKFQYNIFLSSTIDAFHQTVETKEFPATALQYYIQPSISYKISPNIQAGLGYAYVKHNLFGLHVNENRVWAQVVASHNVSVLGRLKMSHRLRYEERYPLNTKTDQWSYATLFRYQLGLTIPLYDPKLKSKGFYAAASEEAFLCMSGAKTVLLAQKMRFTAKIGSMAVSVIIPENLVKLNWVICIKT